jgi:hypothetical protein
MAVRLMSPMRSTRPRNSRHAALLGLAGKRAQVEVDHDVGDLADLRIAVAICSSSPSIRIATCWQRKIERASSWARRATWDRTVLRSASRRASWPLRSSARPAARCTRERSARSDCRAMLPDEAARPGRARILGTGEIPRRILIELRALRLMIGDFPAQPIHAFARHALAIAGLRGRHVDGGKLASKPSTFSESVSTWSRSPSARPRAPAAASCSVTSWTVVIPRCAPGSGWSRCADSRWCSPAAPGGLPPGSVRAPGDRRLSLGSKFELVPAHGRDGFIERGHGFGQRLLVAHVAIERCLVVLVEPSHHLFQLAHLALLRKHAGHRRLARAAGHHAVGIDDLAVEGDQGLLGLGLPPQLERLAQILDDDDVAEQIAGDAIVVPIEPDELEHRPAHALAARPGITGAGTMAGRLRRPRRPWRRRRRYARRAFERSDRGMKLERPRCAA